MGNRLILHVNLKRSTKLSGYSLWPKYEGKRISEEKGGIWFHLHITKWNPAYQTPVYYGHFFLAQTKARLLIFHSKNSFNTAIT